MRVAIITSSDSGYAGQREDVSGPVIEEIVTASGYEVVQRELLPDDFAMLRDAMIRICDEGRADLVLTTGGTGCSPRDVMPEASRRRRADGSRNSGGDAGVQYAVYKTRHADKGCQRDPGALPDREPAGKPQGGPRVSGIYSAGITAWAGNPSGGGGGVR